MSDYNQLRGLQEHNAKLNKIIIESLQQALLLLMEKKDYQKISITELCQKAGVSRMAFYTNFETKDNLLESIVKNSNAKLVNRIGSPFRTYVDLKWYITLFEETKKFAKELLLIFKAGDSFKYKYITIINNLVLHNPDISEKKRYSRLMWSGGVVNVIIDWIENGMKTPIEELANYCLNSFKYLE